MKKTKKTMSGLYLFPAALAAVFMSSVFIIVSPLASKNIVTIPTVTPVFKSVIISSPDLTKPVGRPLDIKGKIDRSWVFENSFPVKILDDQGREIFYGISQTVNWTEGTDSMINFTMSLDFNTNSKTGTLVIQNDNPSGLPQNAKTIEFPLIFKTQAPEQIIIDY